MKKFWKWFNESILGFVMLGTAVVWLFIWIAVEYIPSTDKLSWAQVVIELVLVPLVLYGFYQTRKEIRESQEKPDLVLFWDGNKLGENDSIVYNRVSRGGLIVIKAANLFLGNAGEKIAKYYRIVFLIPPTIELYNRNNNGKWIYDNEGAIKLTCADDTAVVFPDDYLGLDDFHIRLTVVEDSYRMRYLIFCDGMKVKSGLISIVVDEWVD